MCVWVAVSHVTSVWVSVLHTTGVWLAVLQVCDLLCYMCVTCCVTGVWFAVLQVCDLLCYMCVTCCVTGVWAGQVGWPWPRGHPGVVGEVCPEDWTHKQRGESGRPTAAGHGCHVSPLASLLSLTFIILIHTWCLIKVCHFKQLLTTLHVLSDRLKLCLQLAAN